MSSTLEVLYRARRFINDTRRDQITTLTVAATNSGTSLTVASTTGIAPGSIIECGVEQMLVTAVPGTVTVIRGWNGTAPATHAIGAPVIINPSTPMQTLLDSANAELNSLSSPENGLFRVLHADINTNVGKIGFDLGVDDPNGFLRVLRVRYRQSNLGDWMPVTGYQWIVDADTTDFPSTIGVLFPTGYKGSNTARVWYATAFGQLSPTGLTDDVPATTGLLPAAEDILAMGAAIRTVEGREIARAQLSSQSDGRRPSEVPMGNNLQSTSVLRRSRDSRIAEEAARLKARWATQ